MKKNFIVLIIALLVVLVISLTTAVVLLVNDRDKSPIDGTVTEGKNDGTSSFETKGDKDTSDVTGGNVTEGGEAGNTPPSDSNPSETDPSETKPSETKPSETNPSETNPSETKPPVETIPPETQPPVTEAPSDPVDPTDPNLGMPENFEKTLTLRSDTGVNLNVRADCRAFKNENGKITVKVDFFLEHRAIGVGERTATLTVGENKIKQKITAIKRESNTPKDTLLISYEGEHNYGDVLSISGSFPFRGSYSGVEIEKIKLSGELDIYAGE